MPAIPRTVEGQINYLDDMDVRPQFYAVDYARDNLKLRNEAVKITDARTVTEKPSLDREGFTLRPHRTTMTDFHDAEQVQSVYLLEIQRFMLGLTGASRVIMMGGAVLRFGEQSPDFGSGVNTRPARFAHVDYTPVSAPGLLKSALERVPYQKRPGPRYAGYNIWRALSAPPQDVPLAVCDARSVAPQDLVAGDAVFDAPGVPEWGFEAYLLRHNAAHRWSYFSNMKKDEVLVFKAYDTDARKPVRVPHCAFDDPSCPPGVAPRASVEVRCFVYFE